MRTDRRVRTFISHVNDASLLNRGIGGVRRGLKHLEKICSMTDRS